MAGEFVIQGDRFIWAPGAGSRASQAGTQRLGPAFTKKSSEAILAQLE